MSCNDNFFFLNQTRCRHSQMGRRLSSICSHTRALIVLVDQIIFFLFVNVNLTIHKRFWHRHIIDEEQWPSGVIMHSLIMVVNQIFLFLFVMIPFPRTLIPSNVHIPIGCLDLGPCSRSIYRLRFIFSVKLHRIEGSGCGDIVNSFDHHGRRASLRVESFDTKRLCHRGSGGVSSSVALDAA